MKRAATTIVIISLMVSVVAALSKEATPVIKHVTLYPDRALITSEAPVALQQGEAVLALKGLSPYIVRQTIQVSGEGGFTIMGVSHANNFLSATGDSPEVRELKSLIESLNHKVEDEKTAIEVLKERENFMVANRIVTGREAALTAEQYKSLLELYSSNIDLVRTTVLRKTRLIRDYEKQLQDLNNQLSQTMGKARLPSGEIYITVSSTKPVNGKLTISYVVTNAGWHPTYDVRVDGINRPVTLVYNANVFQSTGNDWKGVRLSFTNATPSESGVIPVLNPWYLSFYQPRPMPLESVRLRGVASKPQAKSEVLDEAVYAMAEEAMAPEVMVTTGTTTISFDVMVPTDLMSDGQMKTIEIGRTTTPASFAYESVPKLDARAFLTGRFEKWEDLNIIGGQANLYFENTFVGNTYLSPAQFGDTMKVSLGSDRGITVKRERQTELTSRKLIGTNKVDTRSFRITVRNNKKESIALRIGDQIPVSATSEITVEGTQLSGGRLNPVSGIVTWEFVLEPQQAREIILTYTVKYPKDREIILE
ncbi:MAG: mucoidy inhibitor MuiA family protein [Bacteroidetes bacterium]|nr:mucoidy inhibitor MuiA family protein [Bacteroidota bacterium]